MQLQSVIKDNIFYYLKKLNFCCPAVVTNIDNLKDGFISVQPVIDRLMNSGDSAEYDSIDNVPVIFPSTSKASITFPIDEGDGVLLVFCDKDIDQYKSGVKEQHTPMSFSFLELNDAVAFVGFNPSDESPFNPNNFTNQLDMSSVNLVNNKKTDREVVFSLKEDGSLSCIAPKSVDIKTPQANVDAEIIDCKSGIVKTQGDVEIQGKSVYQFMTTHVHSGVQSGSSKTLPPDPL